MTWRKPSTLGISFLACIFALCWLVNSCSAAAPRPADDGLNISFEYTDLFKKIGSGNPEKILPKLREFNILFVPGFLSDLTIDEDLLDPHAKDRRGPYFNRMISWLRSGGINASLANIESEESVQYNAKKVAASVRRSSKPVIIIAHSKGGLDALEALLAYPDIEHKVAGMITIQSPFQGTPVADHLLDSASFDAMLWTGLAVLGGSEKSMLDLSVTTRKAYNHDNAAVINYITSRIPIICFGSWIEDSERQLDTNLYLIRDFLAEQGLKNDGVVPVNSTNVSGSYNIQVQGPDHLATVKDDSKIPFNRIRFLRTLIELLMLRMQGQPI